MKRVIALIASIAVNAGVFGAVEWNAYVAGTPHGSVSIAQLAVAQAPVYAQAAGG